jgi:hypothetical protein
MELVAHTFLVMGYAILIWLQVPLRLHSLSSIRA